MASGSNRHKLSSYLPCHCENNIWYGIKAPILPQGVIVIGDKSTEQNTIHNNNSKIYLSYLYRLMVLLLTMDCKRCVCVCVFLYHVLSYAQDMRTRNSVLFNIKTNGYMSTLVSVCRSRQSDGELWDAINQAFYYK